MARRADTARGEGGGEAETAGKPLTEQADPGLGTRERPLPAAAAVFRRSDAQTHSAATSLGGRERLIGTYRCHRFTHGM